MGELSEAEVRSISMSVDKENFNSINTLLKEDEHDVQKNYIILYFFYLKFINF